jgi:hypothetical protein
MVDDDGESIAVSHLTYQVMQSTSRIGQARFP